MINIAKRKRGKSLKQLLLMKRRFANHLNEKNRQWPVRRIKLLLFLFCLAGSCISAYQVVKVFHPDKSRQSSLMPVNTKVPQHIGRSGFVVPAIPYGREDAADKNIARFGAYLDSLQKNAPKYYDSIKAERPGLIDSISILEQLYRKQ